MGVIAQVWIKGEGGKVGKGGRRKGKERKVIEVD